MKHLSAVTKHRHSEAAVHVQSDDPHITLLCDWSVRGSVGGNTTLTDPRSRRTRASRGGGQITTRARSSSDTPARPSSCSRRPCPGCPRIQPANCFHSAPVASRKVMPDNNRAENSHRPTRRRERHMQRFKSPEQAQDFLFAHTFIHGHFHPRRHLLTASTYRATRTEAFNVWHQEACAQGVA